MGRDENMDSNRQWWIEERVKKAVEKLEAHGFNAVYVKTKEEAVKEIWKYITPKAKVGAARPLGTSIRAVAILMMGSSVVPG